ncbi:hypothetical protein BC936DRAFT_143380 [Jimgerdemannia flammicorona]|uniref:Uncharacterized protein n=1 Tax=Jimgerdemannia flammicorona TaxID=994334 RepID=A0A432ZZ23_9FUNG|nr:hypothetical protein BC936DRAFT_143380 [Jimgerdemannia flammicorona]
MNCDLPPRHILNRPPDISLLSPIKVEADCSTALPITYEFHRLQPHTEPVMSFRTPIQQICISKPILRRYSGPIPRSYHQSYSRHCHSYLYIHIIQPENPITLTLTRQPSSTSVSPPRRPHLQWRDVPPPASQGFRVRPVRPVPARDRRAAGRDHPFSLCVPPKSAAIYNVRTLRDPGIHANPSNQDPWMSCDYGAHPRSVLIASTGGLELLDFRIPPASAPVTLYIPPAKSRIHAFRRPPLGNAFQTFLATSSEIVVVDQRFPSRPVLAWAHHRELDPPSGIESERWFEEWVE